MLAAVAVAGCASGSDTPGTDAGAASRGADEVAHFVGISAVDEADGHTLTVR